jgi:hypothetical protein
LSDPVGEIERVQMVDVQPIVRVVTLSMVAGDLRAGCIERRI